MNQQVVVITGAFGALGAVVAKAFAQRGSRVILVDRAEAPSPELKSAVGADAVLVGGMDISVDEGAHRAIKSAQAAAGRIDVLVNIAGGFRWQTVAGGDSETWDLLYRLNVRTAVNMCRAVIPVLSKEGRGRIINVGAGAAIKAAAGMAPYAASKAGVHRLTEALAEELKGQATVNAVLPSIIDTPQNRADMPSANFSAWVQPAELASVITFLASEEASAVTGALIPVNGRV